MIKIYCCTMSVEQTGLAPQQTQKFHFCHFLPPHNFAKAVVNDSKLKILKPVWPQDKKHKSLIGYLFKNNAVQQRLATEKSILAFEVRFNVFSIQMEGCWIIYYAMYYGLQLLAFLRENINSIREITII